MAQKYTEAQKKSARKWDAANLDRMSLALPKGSRDTIQTHAVARGESVNGFIKRAIAEAMERDTGVEATAGRPQGGAGQAPQAGAISLSPEALQAAERTAAACGESVADFVNRAITEATQPVTQPDPQELPSSDLVPGAAAHKGPPPARYTVTTPVGSTMEILTCRVSTA